MLRFQENGSVDSASGSILEESVLGTVDVTTPIAPVLDSSLRAFHRQLSLEWNQDQTIRPPSVDSNFE
jgi:hypothetical protein